MSEREVGPEDPQLPIQTTPSIMFGVPMSRFNHPAFANEQQPIFTSQESKRHWEPFGRKTRSEQSMSVTQLGRRLRLWVLYTVRPYWLGLHTTFYWRRFHQ